MAITRAQQVKQMLREGGRIGLRRGGIDRGFQAPSEAGQSPRGSSFGGGADASKTDFGPPEKVRRGGGADSIKVSPSYGKDEYEGTTQATGTDFVTDLVEGVNIPDKDDRDRLKTTLREKNPNPLLEFLDPRKRLYNTFPNDPGTELRFLSRLTPAQAATLPASLKEKYDMIQNTDFSGDLSFKDALGEDYKKFTFDEFENLKNFGDDEFAKYAGEQEGKFGLLLGGNVGNIEVFKNPDGTYGYREKTGRDDNPILFPQGTTPGDPNQDPGDDEDDDFQRFARLMADGGSVDDIEREAMFLGGITKGIKKAVKGIKKIAKSPIGKAALIAGGAGFFGMGPFAGLAKTKAGIGLSNLFGAGSFSPFKAELANVLGADAGFGPSGLGRLLGDKFVNQVTGNLTGMGKFAALGIPSALAGIMTDKQKDEFKQPDYPDFNMQAYLQNPYKYTPVRQAAEGGIMRAGYQEGSKEPVAKKTMPLLDMDGKEMDFREEGGFVPIGRMEKADDVPARLSKNEFVFTADAVRNAGDGNVDKGAEVMYNMMKNLESGGDVSEESQGLQGAREMFQTSKRLEEVL